jgi:preprotein translocase subunit YajC
VVTSGGIIGTVAKVISDTEVALDIADNVRVRVVRSMISQVLAKPEPAGKSKDKDKDGEKGKDAARTAEKEDEDSEVVKTS